METYFLHWVGYEGKVSFLAFSHISAEKKKGVWDRFFSALPTLSFNFRALNLPDKGEVNDLPVLAEAPAILRRRSVARCQISGSASDEVPWIFRIHADDRR